MNIKTQKRIIRSLFFLTPTFAVFCGIKMLIWSSINPDISFIGFMAFLIGGLSCIATACGIIYVGTLIYNNIPKLYNWAFSNED